MRMKETRNGYILIEIILGDSDTAEVAQKKVEKSLEFGESVRSK